VTGAFDLRELPSFASDPWFAPPPAFDSWMPGGACELRMSQSATLTQVHGAVSAVLGDSGVDHGRRFSPFALDVDGLRRVRLILHTEEAAAVIAHGRFQTMVGDRRATLSVGPLQRIRAPVVHGLGPRRVRVEALTPVLIRHRVTDETRPSGKVTLTYRSGHTDQIANAVGVQFCERLGLPYVELLRMEHVDSSTSPAVVNLGRKIKGIAGWVGTVDLRTNGVGEWLLRAAEIMRLGGRTAYGLGRVRVTRC